LDISWKLHLHLPHFITNRAFSCNLRGAYTDGLPRSSPSWMDYRYGAQAPGSLVTATCGRRKVCRYSIQCLHNPVSVTHEPTSYSTVQYRTVPYRTRELLPQEHRRPATSLFYTPPSRAGRGTELATAAQSCCWRMQIHLQSAESSSSAAIFSAFPHPHHPWTYQQLACTLMNTLASS
jgi:hypothetical protein